MNQQEKVIQDEVTEVKTPKKSLWGLTVLILLYILSPIDLLPEAMLGPLGLLDDGALLMYLVKRWLNK